MRYAQCFFKLCLTIVTSISPALLAVPGAPAMRGAWFAFNMHRCRANKVHSLLVVIGSALTAIDAVAFIRPQLLTISVLQDEMSVPFSSSPLKGFVMNTKLGIKRLNTLQRFWNDFSWVMLEGCCSFQIVSLAVVDILSLPGWIAWPKWSINSSKMKLIFRFADTQALPSSPGRYKGVPNVFYRRGKVIPSLGYTNANCHLMVDRLMSKGRWNGLEAFIRPKGILKNLYSPC